MIRMTSNKIRITSNQLPPENVVCVFCNDQYSTIGFRRNEHVYLFQYGEIHQLEAYDYYYTFGEQVDSTRAISPERNRETAIYYRSVWEQTPR